MTEEDESNTTTTTFAKAFHIQTEGVLTEGDTDDKKADETCAEAEQEVTVNANPKLLTAADILAETEELRPLEKDLTLRCHLVVYHGQQAFQKVAHDTISPEVLRREAWALKQAGGQGGAPRLLAAASDASMILMTYVEGKSISSLYQRREVLVVQEWLKVFQAAATSLAELHDAGIVHNDITGRNILIKEEEEGGSY